MNSLPRADEGRANHLSMQLGKLRSPLGGVPWRLCRYGCPVWVCLMFALSVCFGAGRKPAPTQAESTALPPCAEASRLEESARVLYAQGDLKLSQEALAKYNQVLVCWRSIRAHAEAAATLRTIGDVYYDTGQYPSATDAYEQAIRESKSVGDVRGQALALIAIGLIDFDADHPKDLWAHTNEAFSLVQDLHDEQVRAQVLMNYALAYDYQDDAANASRSADEGVVIAERLKNSQTYGRALLFAGIVKLDSGKLTEALDCYQRALYEFQKGGYLAWQARAVAAIGNIYAAIGELQQSLEYDSQALTIQKRLGNRRWQAVTFNNIGYAYSTLGDLEHALDNYASALDCYRDIGHESGQALTSVFVGNINRLLGDYKKADEYYRLGQRLSQKVDDKRTKALSLIGLGLLSQANGNLSDAVRNYSSALTTYEGTGNLRGRLFTRNALGYAQYLMGQKRGALRNLLQGLSLAEKAGDRELEVSVRYNLAWVQKSLGQLDEAKSQIETALQLIESLRLKLASFERRSSYFASVRQFYELYADILMDLHRQQLGAGFDAKAFEVSERARARSLLESLRESEINIRADADATLLKEEQDVQRQLNEASIRRAQLSGTASSPDADSVNKEIDRLTTRYQELEGRIRSNSSRYAAAPMPQPLGLQESRRLLDENSMLLEYMLGDDRSYLWVITSSKLYSFELPPRAQIESRVGEFRKLLIANQSIEGETYEQMQLRVAEAGKHLLNDSLSLGKILLGPIADELGKQRLLIVPDGGLQSIPFQALTLLDAAGSPRALLEDHEIVYEPSASALDIVKQSSAHRHSGSGSVAVFANPVFEADDPRVASAKVPRTPDGKESSQLVKQAMRDVGLQQGHIPPLPASREEADAIMSAVPWRTGFEAIDFHASRTTIGETDFSQYRIAHFATHGFVDYQHPELSGLVLSLVDERGNPQDGFLRMHDIYNLKLPVDLVVLSACNTGLGKEVKGEGLIGLTRGFMYAGARGVVASLWKVDDDATAELMKHFYGGMFTKGLTPAAALRDAQLALRSQKRWQSPYYWAAFEIQGEYDQRPAGGPPKSKLWAITFSAGIVVLFVGTAFLFRWKRRKVTTGIR
jgi:CHAT domain-containing protein/predicted negative regulator of RcsB-dependent stress response